MLGNNTGRHFGLALWYFRFNRAGDHDRVVTHIFLRIRICVGYIRSFGFIGLLIGIYMILLGFTLLALAFMVRRDKQAKARSRKSGKQKAREGTHKG